MGFLGPEKTIIDELNLACDPRSNIKGDDGLHNTSAPKVFAAGDWRSLWSCGPSAKAASRRVRSTAS